MRLHHVLPLLLFALTSHLASAKTDWKVASVDIKAIDEEHRRLTVTAQRGPEKPVSFTVDTIYTSTPNYVVEGAELITYGQAGRTQAVQIISLNGQQTKDWFYCYQPQPISRGRIIFIEWYPSNGSPDLHDVLLLYDTRRTAGKNRLAGSSSGGELSRTSAGVPLFPEQNARERSYDNAQKQTTRWSLLTRNATVLPNDKLLITALRGEDAKSGQSVLVKIDLNRPNSPSAVTTFDISPQRVRPDVQNPRFVDVKAIEVVSAGIVKLRVAPEVYGVNAITMKVSR